MPVDDHGDDAMNSDFYEKRYSQTAPTAGSDSVRIDFIVRHIPDSSLTVLDVGCWEGTYTALYKKTTNTLYGIENSGTAAAKAREKGIIAVEGDFMKNEFFPNCQFDVVVAGEVIEHVFDTDLFLEKVRKCLKPGGRFIVTTPNVASMPRRLLLLFGKNPILENRVVPGVSVGHIRYFTFSDLEHLLADHGFSVEVAESDVVNLSPSGRLYSRIIPRLFMRFGRSIMVAARREE